MLTISDRDTAQGNGPTGTPVPFGLVTVAPSTVPLVVSTGGTTTFRINASWEVQADATGFYTLVVPDASEIVYPTGPIAWTFGFSDGTKITVPSIPAGQVGPVTSAELLNAPFSGTITAGPVPQSSVIQGLPGINWRGTWSTSTAYLARDAVSYAGSSWYALTSSTNVTPGTDGTKWALLAQVGANGAPGPTGATGATGPAGPNIDATTATIGSVLIDQAPASGHPISVTTPRIGAASGVASLDAGSHIPLAQLSGITTAQIAAGAGILKSQLAALGIADADVAAGAAIAQTKLALTGAIPASFLGTTATTALAGNTAAGGDASGTLGNLTVSGVTHLSGSLPTAVAVADGSLSAVSASKLTGSIADARLSANVPLLNAANAFTAVTTLSGEILAGGLSRSGTALPSGHGTAVSASNIGGINGSGGSVSSVGTGSTNGAGLVKVTIGSGPSGGGICTFTFQGAPLATAPQYVKLGYSASGSTPGSLNAGSITTSGFSVNAQSAVSGGATIAVWYECIW